MLIGLPPIGAPPEWGLSVQESINEGLIDTDKCAGRYVSVTIQKASYTGIVIAINSSDVIVYVDQPKVDIVYRPLNACTFVTVMRKDRANQRTMQEVSRYARHRGIIA